MSVGNPEMAMGLILGLPLLAALVCLWMPTGPTALRVARLGTLLAVAVDEAIAIRVFSHGPITAASGILRIDALSAWHLCVLGLVFGFSAIYSGVYFAEEVGDGRFPRRSARRFGALWCCAMAAMSVVLVSNDLGVMWVGMEATTLFTAFLISVRPSRESLEAMWKYILICSIGVALAFLGTLLMSSAAAAIGLRGDGSLLWTDLRERAALLDPKLAKASFVLLLVGYGTKAGLAPVHSWLPDAHSQAPAPVSAIFSSFMLNAALYCVMRFLPVVEAATGNVGWARELLLCFGLLSIGVAAVFIVLQHDLKRLLAYHSVEHLGIIAVGLGLGGLGTFAALFHTLNHSLCKALAFFAAGRLGRGYGGYDLRRMQGAIEFSPLWGLAMLGSLLALVGAAPFALFMSEWQIVFAGIEAGAWWTVGLFLLGAGVVFVGATGHMITLVFGHPPGDVLPLRSGWIEWVLVLAPLGVLLVLGVFMPEWMRGALESAASLLGPGGGASGLLAGGPK